MACNFPIQNLLFIFSWLTLWPPMTLLQMAIGQKKKFSLPPHSLSTVCNQNSEITLLAEIKTNIGLWKMPTNQFFKNNFSISAKKSNKEPFSPSEPFSTSNNLLLHARYFAHFNNFITYQFNNNKSTLNDPPMYCATSLNIFSQQPKLSHSFWRKKNNNEKYRFDPIINIDSS